MYNTCMLLKKVLNNMEVEMLYAALSFIFAAFMLHKILSNTRKKPGPNLPPNIPGSLPIIGHLHLFKGLLPQRLQELSRNLGPVFSIRLGMKYVVVISSSSAVEECFTKHDIVLANRPPAAVERKSLGFSRTSVIGAPYGDLWRNLRKLCDLEVFAPTRLASFLSIRQDEMNRMISSMYKVSCNGFAKVNLETKIVEMTFNNIMRMIAGKRYYGEEAEDDEEAKQFRKLTKEVVELTGSDNIGEVFPFIRWIGCNGLEKRMTIHSKNTDAFMQALIDEHRNGKRRNTMVDHLLSLQASEPESYSDEVIIGLIVALLIAGTDASVVATEWTMSLLLNHPEILEKARQELDTNVGHDRMVEEKDLPKLRYLHYIILETLRLFPSVPMLVPHQPSQDIVVGGYTIPKGTFMMVNAWAIHRDPKVWDDPLSFKPERFENRELETHKLLPFGMGRRACPGSGLAQKFVGLALASMIQCFEWERPSAEKIDLTGGSSVILTKVKTLEAICKPRDAMKNVLQQISSV